MLKYVHKIVAKQKSFWTPIQENRLNLLNNFKENK